MRDFNIELHEGYDPSRSRTVAGIINVGKLLEPISKAQLVNLVSQTPVDNRSSDFNCQVWVGNALGKLKGHGYLKHEKCKESVDRMLDLALEAKDD